MRDMCVDHASPSQAIDRDAILPVIKSTGWHATALEQRKARGDTGELPVIIESLAGDLLLVYVIDRASSMVFLTPADLRALQIDAASLRALALHNLQRCLPNLQMFGGDGRYSPRRDRDYDASIVLLFEHWRDQMTLQGEPVIAIAARDEVMVCGSDDNEAVASLREMAQSIEQLAADGLSAQRYVWREDRLQLLDA